MKARLGLGTVCEKLFFAILLLFFFLFLIWPLCCMLKSALIENGHLTFGYFLAVFRNQGVKEAFANSLLIALLTTLATTLLSLPLAYCLTRLDLPGKGLFQGLTLLPMVMPPFVGALGMRYILARYGSLNLILEGLGLPTADILGSGGLAGVVILETLHLYPIMYLNMTASMASVDEGLLEAARSLGGGFFQTWRRVVFPLLWPGFLAGAAIVFVWAFTDLGTPLVFEFRNCLAVLIYDRVTDMQANPVGYAMVILMLLMTCLVFILGQRLSRRVSVIGSDKGHTAQSLRRPGFFGKLMAYGFLFGVLFLSLLPHVSVVLMAFADKWFMTILPESCTIKYLSGAFTHKLAVSGLRNSLFLSSAATLLDVGLGILLGYFLSRRKGFFSSFLDVLVMLPLAVPGIVLAFGYLSSFMGRSFLGLSLDPMANPVPLLVICYGVRRLPYVVRSVYAGFQHLNLGLEEAGRSLGGGFGLVLRRITLPLLSSHIAAGAILTFAFCMFEVGSTLLLATREWDYPVSKTIYTLSLRLGDGISLASAMGVIGMAVLSVCLMSAGAILGRRMGEVFRS